MTTVSLLVLSLAAADAGQAPPRGVLLDFTATWCGPCQQMNPIVSRLRRQGYPVRKVDVDRERRLAERFNVTKMPTFILVVDGEERMRLVGMQSESQLRRLLAQIPREPKPSVTRNPDPRSVAAADPSRITRVAENERPKTPARSPGFTFPFGRKKSSTPNPPSEPAVIRANLDQDQPRPRRSVEDDPLASSVRVRITSGDGVNYGSGTIIHSKPGRTLILTCGHIFRDLEPDTQVEVDIFTGAEAETYVGEKIGFDMEGDVGLLAITTDATLPASPIAAASDEVQKRQSVYSIGCGGGDPPSREDVFVTALNRYLGPDNIECTGEPMQGRSGGGLFRLDGEVVGVCVAADPREQKGLYAGLKVIHQLLKKHDLSKLVPSSPEVESPVIAKTAPGAEGRQAPGESTNRDPAADAARLDGVAKGRDATLPAGLKAPGEAEVICIVRPLNQPKSASQVVIINRASSRFVSYLTQELNEQPVPTMHRVVREEVPRDLEPPPFAPADELEPPPFAEPAADEQQTAAAMTFQRYRRRRQ